MTIRIIAPTKEFAVGVRHHNGVAMVLVLWMIVLLTIMAASFSQSMRRDTSLVRNLIERAQASALADAGIHYAMLMLINPNPLLRWRGDGSVYTIKLAEARIRVKLYDEVGKINVNFVNQKLLRGLMLRVGLDEDEAEEIADAILDWRDSDEFHRLHGAEKNHYEDAELNYGPRNKPFQTIEELQLVLGVSAGLYQKLEPLVTVYTKDEGIDPRKASRNVLMALPNVDENLVDEYLRLRLESTQDKTPAPQFNALQGVKLAKKGDSTYSVFAEAELPNGAKASVMATLHRKRSQSGLPFAFVNWKRSVGGQAGVFAENTETTE